MDDPTHLSTVIMTFVAQGGPKTGTLFVRLHFIRLNFIKCWPLFKLISLSE